MKIFIVVLILGVCNGMNAQRPCPQVFPLVFDPHCGFLSDCYYNADNEAALDHMSCKRRESGLPDFDRTESGRCPTDKPSC